MCIKCILNFQVEDIFDWFDSVRCSLRGMIDRGKIRVRSFFYNEVALQRMRGASD